MVDMIGAIVATAIYAVLVGVLVGFSTVGRGAKLAAFVAAAVWGGVVVAMAARGGFAPGATGPVPTILSPFVGSLGLLFGGWFFLPGFQSALLSVPLPALVGLNAARLGGVFFLILAADGRLSAPFAPVAGLGDMLVGVLAIPLAAVLAVGASQSTAWLGIWNALGTLDLIVAVSLGVLSTAGTPFQVFTEAPGTDAMTGLPWIMVPSILVPLFLFIHFVIRARVRSLRPLKHAVAMAR
jgi:hypothetical protein